ncbi:VOC family protein [Chloroflexi bacterium TSY]|nr:VOC family protein [Chloroflexi bacterium TSY]
MQLVGIDHVQLAMPEGAEDKARQFYGRLLGLKEVDKPEPLASRGGCWFETPGVIVHLGVEEGFVAARKAHPAFLVSNLDELWKALKNSGAEVVADTSLSDVRRFHTEDPFGNRIEFIQNGNGFSQI